MHLEIFNKKIKLPNNRILFLILLIPTFLFFNNRPLSDQEFWNWYSENADKYYQELENGNHESLTEVGDKLSKVDKNLTYQFGVPDPKTKKAELVISTDGIKEGIPAVQKLVNSAPKYDKWNILAFRQRVEDFGEVEFEG